MIRRPRRSHQFDHPRWDTYRERFQLGTPEPPVAFDDATPLADLVTRLAARIAPAGAPPPPSIADRWPEVAGEPVASCSRPGVLRHGTLVVYCRDATWMQELDLNWRPHLLARVQALFPALKVRQLRLQLDPEPPR